MPKLRKRKHLTIESSAPDEASPRKETSPREDFVGKFLLSVAIALVTGLISQAILNQFNWLFVAAVFVISLVVLAVYQGRADH